MPTLLVPAGRKDGTLIPCPPPPFDGSDDDLPGYGKRKRPRQVRKGKASDFIDEMVLWDRLPVTNPEFWQRNDEVVAGADDWVPERVMVRKVGKSAAHGVGRKQAGAR